MYRFCYNRLVESARFSATSGPMLSRHAIPLKPCATLLVLSPPPHPRKSFNCNTYGPPRKCCIQTTCGRSKSFSCNTYKKQGGGEAIIVNQKSHTAFSYGATTKSERSLFLCALCFSAFRSHANDFSATKSPADVFCAAANLAASLPLSPYPYPPCYHLRTATSRRSFLPDRRSL
jgi:hypothetical protein